MRILFDQGTPKPLKNYLFPHVVSTTFQMGWSTYKNGNLIAAAEAAGFDAIITTDKNLKYQQNLVKRKIAIVVLMATNWPLRVQPSVHLVQEAVAKIAPNSFIEIVFPGERGSPHSAESGLP
jgi:hypothetical protein